MPAEELEERSPCQAAPVLGTGRGEISTRSGGSGKGRGRPVEVVDGGRRGSTQAVRPGSGERRENPGAASVEPQVSQGSGGQEDPGASVEPLSPKSAKDQEDKKTQEQPVLSPKSAKDQEDKKTQEQPVLSPNSVKDQEDKKTQEEPVSQSKASKGVGSVSDNKKDVEPLSPKAASWCDTGHLFFFLLNWVRMVLLCVCFSFSVQYMYKK